MAYKLSNAAFLKGLKEAREVNTLKGADSQDEALFFTGKLPDAVSGPLLEDFIRVLQAVKPSDVDDLSDDRILEMMAMLGMLSDCIEVDNRFTNGQVMSKLRQAKGVAGRKRVL